MEPFRQAAPLWCAIPPANLVTIRRTADAEAGTGRADYRRCSGQQASRAAQRGDAHATAGQAGAKVMAAARNGILRAALLAFTVRLVPALIVSNELLMSGWSSAFWRTRPPGRADVPP